MKLGGTAASAEAMEKAVLIAGNAKGVANREVIKDANLISPGQKIRIPPA